MCDILLFISFILKMPALAQKLSKSKYTVRAIFNLFSISVQLPSPLSKNGTVTRLDFICRDFFVSPANDL